MSNLSARLFLYPAAFLVSTSALATPKGAPPQLHVKGTKILDSRGQQVILRGVNAASMEWSSDGEGHILNTVDVAIRDWHVNIIRLPLAQDRWFGAAPEQKDHGVAYRALAEKVVDTIASQGCYVLVDLHWNDANLWGQSIGQHVMPDMNSVTFWRDAARTFRNNPAVLFDLYNEPHDISWDIWKNGGMVQDRGPTVRKPTAYQTPGMQKLLDTVRAQGANNVVVAGGLDWAYDLSGFLKGFALSDPDGHGVIYACHTYPFKGDTIERWLAKVTPATAKVPVIFSEFGSEAQFRPVNGASPNARPRTQDDPDWVPQTLKAFRDNKWNWIAWDLHPAAGPRLVSDWNYTPTPTFGVPVKRELATPP